MDLQFSESFPIDPESNNGYLRRKLLLRDGRPIGTWSTIGSQEGALWLQNYAGYYSPRFVLSLICEEVALKRAREILTEWDSNPERPTWIA